MSIQVVNNSTPLADQTAAKSESESAPVAKAAEQNESTVTGTEETEAKEVKESDESDDDADGDEPGAKSEESESDKPKKKSGSQRRKERAERAEAEVTRLQQLMEQMALKGAGESKTEPAKPTLVEGKPNPDSFETHSEYVEALTDWKIEQKEKARVFEQNKNALKTEHEKALQTYDERVKSFSEKNADFSDVMAEVDDIQVSPIVQEIIVTSENGPALAYELAKNRAELERICKLTPIAAARELGKLEAKVASTSDEKKPEPKKITKAPTPIAPVGSKGGHVEKRLDDPSLSQREYEAIRRKQMAARRA